jgi:hypothetical protein
MAQQSTTGFGRANPVPYSPGESRHPDVDNQVDTNPSDQQPPGVDEETDYNSLEEALLGE